MSPTNHHYQQKYVPVELLQNFLPYYLQHQSGVTDPSKSPEPTVAAAAAAAVSIANTYFQQQILHQLLQQQQQQHQQHFQLPSHYQSFLAHQHQPQFTNHSVPNVHHQQRHSAFHATTPTAIASASSLKQPVKQTIINKNSELDQVKEHFKRSLGFDCDELMSTKQNKPAEMANKINKKFTTSTINTCGTSITKIKNLDVEDHFIKSLGADYLKRIKNNTTEAMNSNEDTTQASNCNKSSNKTPLEMSPSYNCNNNNNNNTCISKC